MLDRERLFIKGRFDLTEDSAPQSVVVENISKGIEFKGTNLWVLIFAVLIASLGLNVNSTAVIIGAMLISPLMGPIVGMGLSLGINDNEMLKKSLRNFLLMFIVSLITSTLYFFLSPLSSAQSELLARTQPTTYDVLIAFFGGLAGMVAQTRKDRTYVVVAGVAIATALMPPLCTAGFGLATGQLRFFFGALYLFCINTIFIALATYLMVNILKYDKKEYLNEYHAKRVKRYMTIVIIVAIIPSVILGYRIIRRTAFEDNADRYISQVFQFNKTMLVSHSNVFHYDKNKSKIEVKLVGDALSPDVINNLSAQMSDFGLRNTELVIRQADSNEQLDFSTIQKSYSEIINEKNAQIYDMQRRLNSLTATDTLAMSDLSRELGMVVANVGSVSLSKHVSYNTEGKPVDTVIVGFVRPLDPKVELDVDKMKLWLAVRTKNNNVKLYTLGNEQQQE